MTSEIDTEIEWLQRRWQLPATGAAVDAVARLIEAQADGSTAWKLDSPVTEWGAAVGPPDLLAPIVQIGHDGGSYIQARHLYDAEEFIANQLVALAAAPSVREVNEATLAELFPGAEANDLQVAATRTAVTRHLAVITGGPGTGKTYTLARILALLVNSGVEPEAILIAAPTGRAADRMKSAISDSLHALPEHIDQSLLAKVATSSRTVHALLGYNPGTGKCRFHSKTPLQARVIVIDECSMIDALLWKALFEAVSHGTTVILLGDPNQLESVGMGNVFGEIARCARNEGSVLHSAHVHLSTAHRFRDRPGILQFATALKDGDAEQAASLLEARRDGSDDGLSWIEGVPVQTAFGKFPQSVRDALERIADAESPQAAFAALGRICILSAQREFFAGARAIGVAVERHFATRGIRNQPIIINRNDPETGLRNGAVGVIHTDADGGRHAWFQDSTGALRSFSTARLPDFGPAWAITIHRAQGSEYEDVMVILPQASSPLATRELLYTAITRARQQVTIAGDLAVVKKAVATPSQRTTLLAAAIDRASTPFAIPL